MAYFHFWIRIQTANKMVTLYYVKVFTLHGVRFRFQSQLASTGMGSESEYGFVNVNKPQVLLMLLMYQLNNAVNL